MPCPTSTLHVEEIHQAIDEACSSWDDEDGFSLRRARKEDVPDLRRSTSSPLAENQLLKDGFSDFPLYYGLLLENDTGVCGVAIMYVEFSTWEGRVTFLQRLVVPSETVRVPLMRTLAKIAVRLDCVRLVWQHTESSMTLYKKMGASTLDQVLTLKMDRLGMKDFVSYQPAVEGHMTINAAIDAALEPINKESQLRLKLATADDLIDVQTLVQGLADHVNESDAVNVTLEQLRLDGFETSAPLYYCLLLYDTETGKACGVAVIFFGYDIDSGRFLYLEDMFIQEAYRGKRGGTLTMMALASIAQILGCGSFVWQALEWNTPSLKFYDSIGAKVQQGLLTSRFAGQDLERFAKS